MIASTGLDALREALLAIEPNGRFVPRRALRRVIRHCREADTLRITHAVHDRAWPIRRDHLFTILLPFELGLSSDEPADLLLLPRPETEVTPEAWEGLWRTLFHVAIDRQVDEAVARGRLTRERLDGMRLALGPVGWQAIRVVLEEENLIDEDDGLERVWREFAALALEIVHFRPADWDAYFPGLRPDGGPLTTFREVIDSAVLYERTRPAGFAAASSIPLPAPSASSLRPGDSPPPDALTRLHRAARAGNDLKAAITLKRAGAATAGLYVDRLSSRLEAVTAAHPTGEPAWNELLRPLLPAAAAGGWPIERRLLYELQRACLSVEKPAFAADLIQWVTSLGRRPIKRPLPKTRWLEATRRLRAALRYAERLAETGNPPAGLVHAIEQAAQATEERARADLGPPIAAVLDEVGLAPRSVPEQHSRDKLVAELLDRACARGFLRIGDLRDAIARNRVKLPDLSNPIEFIWGDALLRADRKLCEAADGVYRRGEMYLRLLQRACSVFFGTRVGRWLTLYLALPFGGAFLLLEALYHMAEAVEWVELWLEGWGNTVQGFSGLAGGAAGTLAANPPPGPGWATWEAIIVVGSFLFLLLHWPGFRRLTWGMAKLVFWKVPRAIRRSTIVRALVHNPIIRFCRRYLFIPLGVGAVAGLAVQIIHRDWVASTLVGSGIALFCGAFFRTPVGRELEDRVDEAATRLWRIVSVNFVIGLLTLILQVFQAAFEAIDRAIYAVDEWLRFRQGESRIVFVVKLAFGLVWSAVTYVFRFAWTLLVEPQINPIKHFPVVTVSHKLLLPLVPSLSRQFGVHPETMGTIVFGIPGIFGFLVWELRENWKLYRANSPSTLKPMMVGSHGETVRALLRPGFHSGVVPKTFAKLRNAVRVGDTTRAFRYRQSIEHIAEATHHLAVREFTALLAASRRWGGRAIRAGHPVITLNRLILPIHLDMNGPIELALEVQAGWVIGSVREPGRLGDLGPEARAAFADALIGLYKLAGVHVIREQVAAVFGPQAYPFRTDPEGLIIPMPDGSEQFYEYDDGPDLESENDRKAETLLVFTQVPLTWEDWVERWEADAAGKSPQEPLIPGWTVLPGA